MVKWKTSLIIFRRQPIVGARKAFFIRVIAAKLKKNFQTRQAHVNNFRKRSFTDDAAGVIRTEKATCKLSLVFIAAQKTN